MDWELTGGSRILYITLNGKQVTPWDFVGFDVDLAKKPISGDLS